ncbi:MAG: Ni-sirohydrochlorin a,c-diamide synthase [Methanomicrobiaceae archaeon]|uniref:Cobyrinic acid a,c-diamide synthase n=1 Tax=hydrocarbon metagenome TaxID=938273 RepID=A0A0W8FEN6_9ZZZZ|nr:Ni-sirohydrochlorin a,c-diamide synthase [Methanomicrobiaceae archaeon]MDD5419715.1 Ni-sirohydrochlorin a,c-diamide synthase [Methanomicrobiaceae archaeon]
MKALLIAGDRSGSGKTSITLAIAALLSKSQKVQTFKVGMDYIDPSYLTGVTGRPCRNLDGFVMDPAHIRMIFDHGCRDADVALVEGVRGLYEGAEALSNRGSTAEIARELDLNVILVVNARSITRSAAALVKGFLAFDPGVRISGVIANNITGDRHRQKTVRAIEHYCGIPVIGTIPHTAAMELTMRHLGLIPYLEGIGHTEFSERIEAITGIIGEHIDLDRLLALAGEYTPSTRPSPLDSPGGADVRIGVALDEAFNFYYADLFDVLRALGAECVPYSPIRDRLPDADGYILGGGYPELFGKELEANAPAREALFEASRNGTPIYAECGGLIYLTDRLLLQKGFSGSERDFEYEMCGVFSGQTSMPARRALGYVVGMSAADSPLGAASFRGHEFHYSDVALEPGTRYAYRLTRGSGIRDAKDGAVRDRTIASYTHLHPVTSLDMFGHFVDCCRNRA